MDGEYVTVAWVAVTAVAALGTVLWYFYRSDRKTAADRLTALEKQMSEKVAKQDLGAMEGRMTSRIADLQRQLEGDMKRIEDTDIVKLREDMQRMEHRLEARLADHNTTVVTMLQQSSEATAQKFDLLAKLIVERQP